MTRIATIYSAGRSAVFPTWQARHLSRYPSAVTARGRRGPHPGSIAEGKRLFARVVLEFTSDRWAAVNRPIRIIRARQSRPLLLGETAGADRRLVFRILYYTILLTRTRGLVGLVGEPFTSEPSVRARPAKWRAREPKAGSGGEKTTRRRRAQGNAAGTGINVRALPVSQRPGTKTKNQRQGKIRENGHDRQPANKKYARYACVPPRSSSAAGEDEKSVELTFIGKLQRAAFGTG